MEEQSLDVWHRRPHGVTHRATEEQEQQEEEEEEGERKNVSKSRKSGRCRVPQ